jgi:hypothetical protein
LGFWFENIPSGNLDHLFLAPAAKGDLYYTNQGDQIGRIFAQWVIDYSGQLHENY